MTTRLIAAAAFAGVLLYAPRASAQWGTTWGFNDNTRAGHAVVGLLADLPNAVSAVAQLHYTLKRERAPGGLVIASYAFGTFGVVAGGFMISEDNTALNVHGGATLSLGAIGLAAATWNILVTPTPELVVGPLAVVDSAGQLTPAVGVGCAF